MAVTKRPNGTWQVQIVYPPDPRTGKMKRKSWTFDTEREATDFERRKKDELARLAEQHVRPSLTKLREYMGEWLQRKANEGRAASTLHDYATDTARLILPTLGDFALADLSPAIVQRWQDSLAPTRDSPGATMAARAFRCLRSALSDAERLGMIARNPAKSARPAQRSPNKRPGFTLAAAQAILVEARGEPLEPLFSFILHTGLRDAEALGLRWEDVDLGRRTLSVRRNLVQVNHRMVLGKPKTPRSARVFVILPQAAEDLRRQQTWQEEAWRSAGERWQETGAVFTDADGACLRTATVQRTFCRVRDRANAKACEDAHRDPTRTRLIPELPLYSLRHAAASILLNAGVPPAMAAKIMGHSVDIFMQTYAELLVEATREAADAAGAFLEAHPPSKVAAPTDVLPMRTSARGGRPRSRADTHGIER